MKSQNNSSIEGIDEMRRANIEIVHEIINVTEDIKRSLINASKWSKRLPNKVEKSQLNSNIL